MTNFFTNIRQLSLYFFVFLSTQLLSQQVVVQVFDRGTENPISFVKVNDGGEKTYVADIDGKISLAINPSRNYTFRFFNYRDTLINGSQLIKNPTVYLVPDAQLYDDVLVRPGENPAHRIIQNVMENRKKNDPLKNNSFTYDSYSKLYVTGELKEGVNRDTITDTSMIDALEFLDRQYLFLVETKAKRTYNPPSFDQEEITAYNVSGVKDPLFATLVNQFQSFSFYDNNFELNQQEYINPLAPGGLRRYLFVLEDTLFRGETQDTTFIISYRPRTGRNFKGLSGYLYIDANEWALERVVTSPYDNKNVTITQEYGFVNGLKWFPKKISTELDFPISFNNYGDIIGRNTLYISNIVFDQVDKKGFNPVSVVVADGALADSIKLSEYRGDTYTGKEDLTYVTVDSVAKEMNFERTLQILKIASTGRIPVGIFSLPVQQILGYNHHEGIRLGLGLETNSRLSKAFTLGGYFAYGFKDEKFKWGGNLSFNLYKERDIRLNLHYSDDIHERGGTSFFNHDFRLFSNGIGREFHLYSVDRKRSAKVSLSGMIRQNIKVEAYGSYNRTFFLDNYAYLPLGSSNGALDKFDNAEVGVIVNWNIRERVMMLEGERVSLGTKWPRLTFKASKGFQGLFDSQYDYYRLAFNIEQTFKLRAAGSISLMSRSGVTVGAVPLTLSQIQIGTGKQFNPSVINTFETMKPGEFFSDQYTSLYFRYTFMPIKNKTSWTEPLFGIHTAAGVGKMVNVTDHKGFDFKTPEKGYYESGILVDNILKAQFMGIGMGVFYRYGPYALDVLNDNFFYKLSFRFNLGM